MSMKKSIYARTTMDGSIVLSAKLLSDILRRSNGPTVEFVVGENLRCHIKANNADFEILGMSANDFPEIPSPQTGNKINLLGQTLLDMTQGTAFAVAAVEGTRPILMGINVSVTDNYLKFVAIDGYRLAIKKVLIENTPDLSFIIAGHCLTEVTRLITNPDETIPINIGTNMISFEIDGYLFVSRLIEGEFVNYENSIPKGYKQRIVIKVSDVLNILDRISLLISDSFSTPVRLNISEEEIIFNCSTQRGRVSENYEIDLEGEPFEIGISSRYLTEALKAIEDDMVQVRFDLSKQGIVILPMNGDDYMYMIMPMRLK